MATYANTKGFTVQSLSTDPVASQALGGTWATGGDLGTARQGFNVTNAGTQTAGIAVGGYIGSPAGTSNLTELYNGTSWTAGNNMVGARATGYGRGTQSAAWSGLGMTPASPPFSNSTNTETYNGSTWTEVNEANTARRHGGEFGSSTAGFACSGFISPGSRAPNVEYWDGTNWAEQTEMNTPRDNSAGLGNSHTAGLIASGSTPSVTDAVESWNGSAWTEVAEVNTARNAVKGSSASSTDGIIFGGDLPPGKLALTEIWDGTSWTELADLSTARSSIGSGGGSSSSALAFGGDLGPNSTNATEEWSAPAVFAKQFFGDVFFNSTTNAFKVTNYSVPAGTWASGTSFPATVTESGGIGSSASDGLVVTNPAASPAVYAYDGTSWTAAGSMGTYRRQRMLGAGSSTAGLFAGGSTASPVAANKSDKTETWNGSSWTEVNELNQASYTNSAGRCGTSTSAIKAGGIIGSPTPETFSDTNESWNGTNWSEEAELNTGRRSQGGTGTSNTNSMIIGGGVPPNNASDLCEKWNGTSWTETGDLNTARYQQCAAGDTGSALSYGGNLYPSPPPYSALTEIFNGTSWAEASDLSMGRQYLQGGGSSSGCIGVGGYGPTGAVVANTEEWTAPLGNQTITST